jgi:hypothetical protein
MLRVLKGESSSEILQISILTLAMTGGGFFLLWLVLRLWLIPSVGGEVGSEKRQYEDLVKLLDDPKTKELRDKVRGQEGEAEERSVDRIITEELAAQSLEYSSLNPDKKESATLVEESWTLKIKPAQMHKVLQFVARVRGAKKSVRVASFNLNRVRAGRDATSADSWTADVEFVEFRPKKA